MAGHDVFISYSRDDRPAARHFAECLEEEGFSVWWDAALHAGESFDQVIERELKAAMAAIVLWSPRSVASRWVRAEATLADRHGKLIPVIIESCERPIIFELTHTNDFSDWLGDKTDSRWKMLVQDLRRLMGVEKRPAMVPSAANNGERPWRQAASPAILPAREPSSAEPLRHDSDWHWKAAQSDDSQATQFSLGPACLDVFHCLEIDGPDRLEQRFVVSPQGLKIGRSAPADIVLSDRQVSRTHCKVELDGDGLRITDLSSTNGTFIDGQRIDRPAVLAVGATLRVGEVSLRHQVRSARNVKERKFAMR